MMPSRGMGAVLSSKMPKAKTGHRKDGDKFLDNGKVKRRKDGDEFTYYSEGGGLYENIHKKRERIAAGSSERMRRAGAKGAPTDTAFRRSAKTAKR
jgi:hypothetical protein